jgi:transposase-like protein DUF772
MQGRERADRSLLDAQALVGHLVPAGSMFAFLAAHRGELFPDGEFADLFPSGRGRPSVPASVMASVMVLQALHDYSDPEAAEAARCDLRWKAACGFPLDHGGFDPSTLVYWRQRIAKSDRPDRVNDAVRVVIGQTGVLAGRRRRVVDSTILADAVATQDTITQLVSAVRRVGRVVPGAAEQIAAVCTGHDYAQPGKPKIDWDDPAARQALVSALVNDANALVAAFAGAELEEPAASAVALLALVAGQDVEPAEGSDGTDGRWRIARNVAEDRVISTVDPDARHTRKSPEARRDGYRVHVAAEPETGLITDEELTKAAGEANADAAVAGQMIAREAVAAKVYGDSAYGTGELRAARVSCARDLEVLPSRPRHWAECCHYVEAPCSSLRPITRARADIVPGLTMATWPPILGRARYVAPLGSCRGRGEPISGFQGHWAVQSQQVGPRCGAAGKVAGGMPQRPPQQVSSSAADDRPRGHSDSRAIGQLPEGGTAVPRWASMRYAATCAVRAGHGVAAGRLCGHGGGLRRCAHHHGTGGV